MKIILLSYANTTSNNSASYNRMMSYVIGLKKTNYNISLLFASHPNKSERQKGLINEVIYEFVGNNKNYRYKILNVIDNFKLFSKTCNILLKEKKSDNKLILGIPVGNPFLSSKYIDFCSKNGIITFQERSEFPEIGLKTTGIKKIKNLIEYKYYMKRILPRINYMILMTKILMEYYSKFVNSQAKLFHMPMTVDIERFINVESFTLGYKYIAYCGTMNIKKDGVNILIKAFNKILKQFPNLKLLLIGPKDRSYYYISELIDNLQIKDSVIFTGSIYREHIPRYLCGAEALCLARPESRQSIGGFPTKLGEYLLTGKPVVVTKVGEIPHYLSDNKNCYMAEPNSVDSFYSKLLEAITSKNRISVGKIGRETAMKYFNNLVQSKKLGEFFEKNI